MSKLADIIVEDAAKICSNVNFEEINGKTILITGASGLIGVYFIACLKYLSQVQKIRFAVHASIQNKPLPYLKELLNFDNVKIHRGDLTKTEFISILPKSDIIIHAAGYAQPSLFMANPLATIQINTTATAALIKKLSPGGIFLFLSSSEIYSGLNKHLLSEGDIGLTTPAHPRAAYIEGKRCGEAICNAFLYQGIQVKIARVSSVYGPGTRKHDGRALSSFIEKALLYDKIELSDAGNAVRTYCYVADTVELLWHILLHGKENIYNVGGRSTTTIAELARMIGKIMDKPVVFPHADFSSAGAPLEVRLNSSKAETEFGKAEYVEFEKGVKRTISWLCELYSKK